MRCATDAAAVGGTLLVAITAIGDNVSTTPAIALATARQPIAPMRFSHGRCPAPARPHPVGKRHALPCPGKPPGRALLGLSGRGLERRARQGPLPAILHPIDGHRRMDRNSRQCRRRPCRHSLPVPGAGPGAAWPGGRHLRHDQKDSQLAAKGLLVNFLDLSSGRRLAPLVNDVTGRCFWRLLAARKEKPSGGR